MSDEVRNILAVNEEFYRVFRDRDVPGMVRIWSSAQEISVVHPGWEPLQGRGPVVESWQRIMQNPASPQVRCGDPFVILRGDVGIVVCTEQVGGACLAATNIFVREGSVWKLIHHQAGAMPPVTRQKPAGQIH